MRLTVGHELPGSRIQVAVCRPRGQSRGLAPMAGWRGGLTGKLQRLPVTDPLATASVLALMEDREGNLWVGTETGGLHILRDQRFRTIGAREGLSSDATTTVVEDSAGTLWVGTSGSGLNALGSKEDGQDRARATLSSNGLLSDVILSLAAAPNGDLWVGTPDGLNRFAEGRSMRLPRRMGCPTTSSAPCLRMPMGRCGSAPRRGLTHWTEPPERNRGRAHGDFYPGERAGQRSGGRHGARCKRRPVGGHAGRPLTAARRQDRQLHYRQRALQQRDYGAAARARTGRC